MALQLPLFCFREYPQRVSWRDVVSLSNRTLMSSGPSSTPCPCCSKAKGYRLPIHRDFFEGRSDLDWFLSIRDYLRWRAGASWRPARHRGECAVQSYRDAIAVLTHAFHETDSVTQVRQVSPTAIAVGDTHVSPADRSSTVPKKPSVSVPTDTPHRQVLRQGRVNGAVRAAQALTVRLQNA